MFWFNAPASAWGGAGCWEWGLVVAGVKRFLDRFTAKCGVAGKFIVEGDVRVAASFWPDVFVFCFS